MKKIVLLLAAVVAWANTAWAQEEKNEDQVVKVDTSETKILVSTPKRFYMGNGYDFLMFSSSGFTKAGRSKLTTLRFTGAVNIGLNFHYDFSKRFGLFTGVSLKNLGFIDQVGDETRKYRVYTIGVPLGIKIGDLRNRNFVFGGGGIDAPFHFKIKGFKDRGNKSKYTEWFSDMTPRIMPCIFLGLSIDPGFIIKAQYYPGNFFNTAYEDKTLPITPYRRPLANYKANIFALSLSVDIHYNQYKIQEREYRKWKAEQDDAKKKIN